MVPPSIGELLSHRRTVNSEYYKAVTVMFYDMHGLPRLNSKMTATELIGLLNVLYGQMDLRIQAHDVYKVEAINDSCMIVSGTGFIFVSLFIRLLVFFSMIFLVLPRINFCFVCNCSRLFYTLSTHWLLYKACRLEKSRESVFQFYVMLPSTRIRPGLINQWRIAHSCSIIGKAKREVHM